jgi:hypothetical protein
MNYILDIKTKKYNLGCVPNILISYYIHNLNLQEVLSEYKLTLRENIITQFNKIYNLFLIKIDTINKNIEEVENLEEKIVDVLDKIRLLFSNGIIGNEKIKELEMKRLDCHKKLKYILKN